MKKTILKYYCSMYLYGRLEKNMFKLTKTQETELRKFIADTGNIYGINTYAKPISGKVTGFRIMNPNTDFAVDVALNASLFVDHDMALEDTETFKELTDSIEKIVFETAAFEYLMEYLDNNGADFLINFDEYCRIVSFEVYSPNDINYEFFLEFCCGFGTDVSINENEDIISYEIFGDNMMNVKKLIKSSIDQLIAENKIYSKYNGKEGR